ncbi:MULTISPECIES: hypothetical protein [unclassified Arsukibacterium]|uniref:hypothetical protein n=1 Tax=unclassified Arsukibacterium TaxID=2635278 RepID=UPI000C49A449|nr:MULTISPECIES: hypothetical protein [unclassified Arsukibacterium]MAA93473.1 hypothetical protein [Rheinheimera sp.]MBM34807.1 hypothetical protein [Rheinheimera sp.]|tara:strand:- start:87 stop:884 length:798 start_codon:yes stop_codon:yes gene_type:complete
MTIIAPLLLSLAVNSTAGYSQTELRTLQYAVNSYAYSAALEQFYHRCVELNPEQYMVKKPDNTRFHSLLQLQLQLNPEQFISNVAANPKFQQRVPDDIGLTDCANHASYQRVLDKYELELFALEIASPVKVNKQSPESQRKQSQQLKVKQAKQLLERSKAVAMVSIIDRNSLSTLEQSDFLHPEYKGRYIYKVELGWRNIPARYMGMQNYLTEQQFAASPKSSLLLLDQHNQFLKVFDEAEAKVYLNLLGKPEWHFDNQGNLQRK